MRSPSRGGRSSCEWLRVAMHGSVMALWVLGCEQAWVEQACGLRAGVGRASVLEQASAQCRHLLFERDV